MVDYGVIGHASVYVKGNLKVLVDPFANQGNEKYADADVVLITHEHFDHCSVELLKRICKNNVVLVFPEGCKDKLKDVNAEKIVVNEGDKLEIKGMSIEVVPAYNINKPYHPRGLGVGYLFKVDDLWCYHTGDSDLIPEMQKLKGRVDVLFVPISGVYVMDEDEAVECVKLIEPKVVVPMHYNYLKGLEKDVREFVRKCRSYGYEVRV